MILAFEANSVVSLNCTYFWDYSPYYEICYFFQVLLYATALNETIKQKGFSAKSNGELIVKNMWNRTIQGEWKISDVRQFLLFSLTSVKKYAILSTPKFLNSKSWFAYCFICEKKHCKSTFFVKMKISAGKIIIE